MGQILHIIRIGSWRVDDDHFLAFDMGQDGPQRFCIGRFIKGRVQPVCIGTQLVNCGDPHGVCGNKVDVKIPRQCSTRCDFGTADGLAYPGRANQHDRRIAWTLRQRGEGEDPRQGPRQNLGWAVVCAVRCGFDQPVNQGIWHTMLFQRAGQIFQGFF